MSLSVVDFSAQFGGEDAAAAVLPHFKALKAAARELRFEGFPFAELAFILRVDGEVHCFGFSGVDNLEVDKDGEYLSVDIGINHDDRDRIPDIISNAIIASIELIKAKECVSPWHVDFTAMQRCLSELTVCYRERIKDGVGATGLKMLSSRNSEPSTG